MTTHPDIQLSQLTALPRFQQAEAWLDQHYPDWYRRISIDRLNIACPHRCILGQLGGYNRITDAMRDDGLHVGGLFSGSYYEAAWCQYLAARRADQPEPDRVDEPAEPAEPDRCVPASFSRLARGGVIAGVVSAAMLLLAVVA